MKLQFLGANASGHRIALLPGGRRRQGPRRLRHVPGARLPGPQLGALPAAARASSTPWSSPTPIWTTAACCPGWCARAIAARSTPRPLRPTWPRSCSAIRPRFRKKTWPSRASGTASEGRKGGHPEVPLYTIEDVDRAVPRLKRVAYGQPDLGQRRTPAHLPRRRPHPRLGQRDLRDRQVQRRQANASSPATSGSGTSRSSAIPTLFEQADYVIMESTYGDRDHDSRADIETQLGRGRRRNPARPAATWSSPSSPSNAPRKCSTTSAG